MFLITLDRDIRGCTTHAFFILRTYVSVSVSLSHSVVTHLSLPISFTLRIAKSYRACNVRNKFYPDTRGSSDEAGISSRKRIDVRKVSNSSEHGWHVTSRGRSPNICSASETRRIHPPFALPMTARCRSTPRSLSQPAKWSKNQVKYSPTYELPRSPLCLCCPTSAILRYVWRHPRLRATVTSRCRVCSEIYSFVERHLIDQSGRREPDALIGRA